MHELPSDRRAFNERLMRWAWATVLDAPIAEPDTATRSAEEVQPFCGTYETVANIVTVAPHGDGISLEVVDRPEVLEELGLDPEQEPPVPFLFRAGDEDRIICSTDPYRGSRGVLHPRRQRPGHRAERVRTLHAPNGIAANVVPLPNRPISWASGCN